ncbi:MAG TPA: response regulator transcription factor [Nitriliruptorales bacterium]
MVRVLVVEPRAPERDLLIRTLAQEASLLVVGGATGVDDALRRFRNQNLDVIVVAFQQQHKEGTQAVTELREGFPQARVVVRSRVAGEPVLLSAFAVGAHALVMDESSPIALVQAVRAVHTGGTFVDPSIAGKLVELAVKAKRVKGPHGLTVQQRRVLERLPRGLTNIEIGEELGISENTVKTHVRNILRKLDVDDRAQASAVAKDLGLL